MSNIGDVVRVIQAVNGAVNFRGCSEEFARAFNEKVMELHQAICKEQGIPPRPRSEMRAEVALGTVSEELFTEFKQWLNQKGGFSFK